MSAFWVSALADTAVRAAALLTVAAAITVLPRYRSAAVRRSAGIGGSRAAIAAREPDARHSRPDGPARRQSLHRGPRRRRRHRRGAGRVGRHADRWDSVLAVSARPARRRGSGASRRSAAAWAGDRLARSRCRLVQRRCRIVRPDDQWFDDWHRVAQGVFDSLVWHLTEARRTLGGTPASAQPTTESSAAASRMETEQDDDAASVEARREPPGRSGRD